MKGDVYIFGDKPGVVEAVRKLGYSPVLIAWTNPLGVERFHYISERYALSGQFKVQDIPSVDVAQIRGVIPCMEYFVEMAAKFKDHYCPHLPGLDAPRASTVRDKLLMKAAIQKLGMRSARFLPIRPNLSWVAIETALGSKVLVKPRRVGGARFMTVISTADEWRTWCGSTPDQDNYYLEEFFEGIREFCCDTLVVGGQILAQFPGEYSIDCLQSNHLHDGFGVVFPGFASDEQTRQMKEWAAAFIRDLKVQEGLCHVEFLLHEGEVYFGEIGVRLAGGLQLPAQSILAGVDLTELYVALFIQAEAPNISALRKPEGFVGYHLYAPKAGQVTAIETDWGHPWIVDSKLFVKVGDVVEPEDSSVAAVGQIIFTAASLEQLKQRAQLVPALARFTYSPSSPPPKS